MRHSLDIRFLNDRTKGLIEDDSRTLCEAVHNPVCPVAINGAVSWIKFVTEQLFVGDHINIARAWNKRPYTIVR